MMNKLVILLVFFGTILILLPTPVEAKRKIPVSKGSGVAVSKSVGVGKFTVKPALRRDRKALVVPFSNLGSVQSFSYELTYTGSGMSQGVVGTVRPKGEASARRELLFGTCSKNVCRYHTGIEGMRLSVVYTQNSGQKMRKTFRIKV